MKRTVAALGLVLAIFALSLGLLLVVAETAAYAGSTGTLSEPSNADQYVDRERASAGSRLSSHLNDFAVTSTADTSPGTPHPALLDADNERAVIPDSAVVPPGSPVTSLPINGPLPEGSARPQDTDVSGTIITHTTWTVTGSPYILTGDVVVAPGITLTIEAGTMVKFDNLKALTVQGTLMAHGTAASPITFTSNVGANKGDWGYIYFADSSTDATFDGSGNYVSGTIIQYAVIEYAGGASVSDNGVLRIEASSPYIDHNTIRNNKGDGIHIWNSGAPRITNNSVRDNSLKGIYASTNQAMIISNNTISTNGFGGIFAGDNATISDNTVSNNAGTGILAGANSSITGNTISDNNLLLHCGGWCTGGGIDSRGGNVSIRGNIISRNTAALGGGIFWWGVGSGSVTISNNIVSGNTAASSWNTYGYGGGIYVRSGTTVILSDNTISGNTAEWGGGIYVDGNNPTISSNAITSNTSVQAHGGGGIYISSSAAQVINDNDLYGNIADNSANDLTNARPFGSADVNAENNYWGTTDANVIEDQVWHFIDDSSLGIVDYAPWLVVSTIRQPEPLTLEQPVADAVSQFGYIDYHLVITAGLSLVVEVTPLSGSETLWVYGRLDDLPLWTLYDLRTQETTARGTYELLISPTQDGIYYFSVYGRDVADTGGSYEITVNTVERRLSDISPRSAGNAGEVTLNLLGIPFTDGMGAELRAAGLPTVVADSVTLESPTSIWAHFDLYEATVGVYDVFAIWPDGGEEMLEAAFEVTPGLGPHLEAHLDPPDFVRPDRSFVLSVDYANTGDADMAVPLFIVSSPDGVPMRLADEESFEDRPVQVLGVASQCLAGSLPPGEPWRKPIYFHVPPGTGGHEMLDFDLSVMTSDDTPIDWDAVEAEIRPADVNPEVWDIVWPILTAQIGDTWRDYRQALVDDANYLCSLGRAVYNVRDLFRFEARKAMGMNPRTVLAGRLDAYAPAPGMPLQFGRVYPGSLEGRFYLGPLGRGWSHSYDIYLEEQSDGDVLMHWPGGFTRLFTSNGDGTYSALPGDYGNLTRDGDIYTLTEKDGTLYRFRVDGQLDYVEDLNGNRITAVYDGAGRLIEVQHSGGESFTLEYNAHGRISHLTDHVGRVTEYSYDPTGGYLLTVTAPGNRVTTYTYNSASGQATDHALLSIAYPNGTHQYYAYDSRGRLSDEHLDGEAERVSYTYDADGRIHITDARGETAIISPDEHGRPAKVTDALGRELSQEYSPEFNLTRLTDTAGQDYEFNYDLLGNVIASENPLGHQVKLGYDTRFSKVAYLEDARSYRSTFQYDDSGNLTSLTYPDSNSETIAYDAVGNPITYSSRNGDMITYTHNADGQLLRKDYADGSWVAYTYDAAGNMTTAADASGTITMTYDADTDLLTRITYPSGHYFEYDYNDAGQRTQRRDQDGRELNYEYDAAGRLARLYDETGTDIVSYEYDNNGRLSRETKGNDTYTTYAYDEAGQLLSMVNYAPDDSVQSRFDYTYDANGNRISMTTLEGTTTYEYDLTGQLTGVTYPNGRHVTYEYDAAGNRVTVTDDGTPTAYTTNNLNQYTQVGAATYTYDENGNMTSKTDATGTATYEYDAEDRLIRVVTPADGTWEYTYDALGNRIGVEHDGAVTRYVHDPIGLVDVAAEYDGSGTLVARYVHGMGLAARIDVSGDAAYYSYDATGHTRQLTDDAGAVANTYDYTPFGIPLQVDETIPNPFHYVGRFGVMAEGNGMSFMRARYYDPSQGRFTSADPINIIGGINLYSYVDNNPVSEQDPVGLIKRGWTYWVPEIAKGILDKVQESLEKAGLYSLPFNLGGVGELAELAGRNWGDFGSVSWGELSVAAQHTLGKVGDVVAFLSYDVPYWWFTRNLDTTSTTESLGNPQLPSNTTEPIGTDSAENITPIDPNEKVGPAGFGEQQLVSVGDELQYVVYFENVITATVPAQEVFVTDYLDLDLDWTTFRLTEIAWGDIVISIPDDTYQFTGRQTVADHRDEVDKSWWVDITTELNPYTGRVEWTFRTLDPDTGELPMDVFAGFLPPNDDTGRGEGHVSFSIRPHVDVPDGALVTNKATIVFDTNEPIETNEVWNTTTDHTPGLRIRVNQTHDWVDASTSLGATVWVTVTDALSNVKGTANGVALREGGAIWAGDFDWGGSAPDIVVGDRVDGSSSDGGVATATIITITGQVDAQANTLSGQVLGVSYPATMRGEIWEEGATSPETQTDDQGYFTLDFNPFDIQPRMGVAAWYIRPDSNWVGAISRSIVVTSTADSGAGTLRQALLDAASGDTITFDPAVFPPDSLVTITLTSGLPELSQGNLTIDASDTGVILDGSGVSDPDADGFIVRSAGNVIRGLQILNFPRIGIHLVSGADNNTIGGDATVGSSPSGQGNVIGGNDDAGIYIGGGHNNVIVGNRIGVTADGLARLGNQGEGVLVREGAQNNRVGGTTASVRNIISGNRGHGVVLLDPDTNDNTVIGSFIGTNIFGTEAISNTAGGVLIEAGARGNRIGGNIPGERNIISGNGGSGIEISGSGTMSNTLSGNYIGTDASGTTALGNEVFGVFIGWGAEHNRVGGSSDAERNILSGNHSGVRVSGAMSNTISGNYIGTDVAGTAAIQNAWDGIRIDSGSRYNVVGGSTEGERNVISGNGAKGVFLADPDTDHNVIIGNYLGTDAAGTTAIANGMFGVVIYNRARYNRVGGATTAERNLISGNNQGGVDFNNAYENQVIGNYIGTDASGLAALSNVGRGVDFINGSQRNIVGGPGAGEGNIIAHNTGPGVYVNGSRTISNTITHNSIHSNGSLGIDNVDGGNRELPPPAITRLTAGSTITGTACAGCTVEVFSDDAEEGRIYEGTTMADGSGQFTFAKPGGFAGPNVTATATDSDGNTSEFSRPIALIDTAPPAVSQTAASPTQPTAGTGVTITAHALDVVSGVAAITATIRCRNPDVATTLTLYDDGVHGDGAADDDVYGNLWTTPTEPREYLVDIYAVDNGDYGRLYANQISFSTLSLPVLPSGTWESWSNVNYVQNLAFQGDTLWAATAGGMVRWDTTTGGYTKYTVTDGLASNNNQAVTVDHDGKVWIGAYGGGGLNLWNGSAWQRDNRVDRVFVNTVAVDNANRLWVGTENGLLILNGDVITTHVYLGDYVALANNWVNAIAFDADGNAWLATYAGVNRLTPDGTWTTYNIFNSGLASNYVASAGVDSAGNKWFGTYGGGVSRLAPDGTWITYDTSNSGLAGDYVYAIAFDSIGNAWFGTDVGVSVFDGSTWTTFTTANSGLASDGVFAIAVDGADNIWFGTAGGGISRLQAGSWSPSLAAAVSAAVRAPLETTLGLREADVELPDPSVRPVRVPVPGVPSSLVQTADAGTADNGTWTTYAVPDILPHNYAHGLAVDNQGRAWVGTHGGAAMFDSTSWVTYTTANSGLYSNFVWAVTIDQSDKKWFAGQGVSVLSGTEWITYTTANSGLTHDSTRDTAFDSTGRAWIATYGGVSVLSGTNWITYTTVNSDLPSDRVYDIVIDQSGVKWFATDGGLSRFDGSTWTNYTTADGLPTNDIIALTLDNDGRVWFSPYGSGVAVLDDGGTADKSDDLLVTFTTADGLASNWIRGMAVDAQGRKWFGASGYGVSVLDDRGTWGKADDRWQSYTSAHGLANNYAWAVAVSPAGDQGWFGTLGGVSKFTICPDFAEPRGMVDIGDVQFVAARWRQRAAGQPYDLDLDRLITVVDIMKVVARWGDICSSTIIGVSEVPLDGRWSMIRSRETNEGDLVADALLWQARQLATEFGAPLPEVAFQNGGGIRNHDIIPPGLITEGRTFGMLPFLNFVTIVQDLTPEDFKALLENAVSRVNATGEAEGNGTGRFAQIAGFRFTYDSRQPAGERVLEAILDDGTVMIRNGAIAATARNVHASTNDFLARGGDEYDIGFAGHVFTTLDVTYRQALRNYIQDGLDGVISATDYPEDGLGRITNLAVSP